MHLTLHSHVHIHLHGHYALLKDLLSRIILRYTPDRPSCFGISLGKNKTPIYLQASKVPSELGGL